MAAQPFTYKPQLDSLRAIAAVAVMFEHFPHREIIDWKLFQLGYVGALGVILFFVLSGYLITGILLTYRFTSVGQALKRFYIRRTLRIFPIYHLTLIVLFIYELPSVSNYFWIHVFYLSNVLFTFRPSVAAPIAHIWSLGVEEQFYLIWPFLILLAPYKALLRIILWSIGLGVLWKALIVETLGDHLAGGVLLFSCLDSLALGALLAYVEQDPRLQSKRQSLLVWLACAGAAIVCLQILFFMTDRGKVIRLVMGFLGPSFIYVWLVGGAATGFTGCFGGMLNWKPLRYAGKISYGIYLYHYFMPGLARSVIIRQGFEAADWIVSVMAFSLTLIAAMLSWHLIEKPISRLKDRLYGH